MTRFKAWLKARWKYAATGGAILIAALIAFFRSRPPAPVLIKEPPPEDAIHVAETGVRDQAADLQQASAAASGAAAENNAAGQLRAAETEMRDAGSAAAADATRANDYADRVRHR